MPIVTFIMIDGLRPEAVTPEHCPALSGVMTRGASTLRASSVLPSITLPCHMSIFHSVPPVRHGVTTNTWSPMARPLPGLVDVAKASGKRCAFIYNWEPLRNVSQPGSLWFAHFRDTAEDQDGDVGVAAEAARAISSDRLDFVFIYFGTVDTAGHAYGWMSHDYLAQAAFVDRLLKTVLDALPTDSLTLIHSDHGGHDRNHGTDLAEDMTIPWVIAGPGIRQGYTLTGPVSLLDTAPTLARLLGLSPHHAWEGRCVEEAFEA
ncbi:MAG TPA: alkaline phosphatase family protein [Anaerolineales bacterium]|nr:alkaline phosphatase family protein [Anaerolineales bacterium]